MVHCSCGISNPCRTVLTLRVYLPPIIETVICFQGIKCCLCSNHQVHNVPSSLTSPHQSTHTHRTIKYNPSSLLSFRIYMSSFYSNITLDLGHFNHLLPIKIYKNKTVSVSSYITTVISPFLLLHARKRYVISCSASLDVWPEIG